ncbi:Ubiquitin-protein ligase [Cichlidogyrus casuarinus]|uniref:E3 ubiquitin-protein ligase n=1 Tax=Cichlidogyrus casuarinus TaxID=1844966 RepID=A0ABD2QDQ1_9PLAT
MSNDGSSNFSQNQLNSSQPSGQDPPVYATLPSYSNIQYRPPPFSNADFRIEDVPVLQASPAEMATPNLQSMCWTLSNPPPFIPEHQQRPVYPFALKNQVLSTASWMAPVSHASARIPCMNRPMDVCPPYSQAAVTTPIAPASSNQNRLAISLSAMMNSISSAIMNGGSSPTRPLPSPAPRTSSMVSQRQRSSRAAHSIMTQSVSGPSSSDRMGEGFLIQSSNTGMSLFPAGNRPSTSTSHGIISGMLLTGSSAEAHHAYPSTSSGLLSSEVSSSLNFKIAQLKQSRSDRALQLTIMQEINQSLLLGFEESLANLNVFVLVEAIVEILATPAEVGGEHLVELKNLGCNVLTHMMDTLPKSSEAVVPAIPLLLKTMNASCVGDILERVINVLEQISRLHGSAVLHSGAISDVLQFYGFVTAAQHRTILNMVCNCLTNLQLSDFGLIQSFLPALADLLEVPEQRCVERVCTAYSRLVNAYARCPKILKLIVSDSFLCKIQHLLTASPALISSALEILQLLATLCTSCSELAVALVKQSQFKNTHTLCMFTVFVTIASLTLHLYCRCGGHRLLFTHWTRLRGSGFQLHSETTRGAH